MPVKSNPIICALDTPDVAQASQLGHSLSESIGAIKLGLEFFCAHGAEGVAAVSSTLPLFLDLKFHDIPNTVHKAILATASLKCLMMTVHTAGGPAMMRAAAEAADRLADETGHRPMIIGVTVLTSLDQADLDAVGYAHSVVDQACRLSELAQRSGLDGVVCSPQEIAAIRSRCGLDFTLVTPGIRPEGSKAGDQKRTMTPREAIAAGADYLVIGRPITEAADPAAAAAAIAKSLA